MDNISTYNCPNCGSTLNFSVDEQGWVCDYCGSEYDQNVLEEICKVSEMNSGNLECYQCLGCGANIFFGDVVISDKCVYCGSNLIRDNKSSDFINPSKLIPFKISHSDAEKIVKDKLSEESNVEFLEIKGVYVPYVLYDLGCKVESMSHIYEIDFHGISLESSVNIKNNLARAIEPFDYSELTEYNSGYLAGFYAETYTDKKVDVSFSSCRKVFKEIKNDIPRLLRKSLKLDFLTKLKLKTIKKIKYTSIIRNYILLPVWIARYKIGRDVQCCIVNGQTGRVFAEFEVFFKKPVKVIEKISENDDCYKKTDSKNLNMLKWLSVIFLLCLLWGIGEDFSLVGGVIVGFYYFIGCLGFIVFFKLLNVQLYGIKKKVIYKTDKVRVKTTKYDAIIVEKKKI